MTAGRWSLPSWRGAARDDGGYVMVLTAVLLGFGLLTIVALGIDVGAWYTRGAQVQRAADAAALAGVVHMPGDFAGAEAEALRTAAKNGFVDGTDSIQITVSPHPTSSRRLIVTILDAEVESYFGRAVLNDVDIERTAVGEYTEPILLGSPKNWLGTGSLTPSGDADSTKANFWLSVNGYCTAKEEGDLSLSRYDGTSNDPTLGCGTESLPIMSSSSEPNADYNPAGYAYAIVVPASHPVPINIEFYDGAYCPTNPSTYAPEFNQYGDRLHPAPIDKRLQANDTQVSTYYRVRQPDTMATPFFIGDDVILDEGVISSDDASCNRTFRKWASPRASGAALTINAADPPTAALKSNRYHVEVWTQREESSFGFNQFGLRASLSTSANTRCDVRYSASCPQVSGETAMSVYADSAGTSATFYLAQIGQNYAGKTMVVSLWDPGEGGQSMRVFNPDSIPTGNNNPNDSLAEPFNWRTPDPPYLQQAWQAAYELDVSGCGAGYPQPGPSGSRYGNCRFNDRKVELLINVPTSYEARDGGWWRIRYKFATGTTVTDRTTWLVKVLGDPVHLTRDDS